MEDKVRNNKRLGLGGGGGQLDTCKDLGSILSDFMRDSWGMKWFWSRSFSKFIRISLLITNLSSPEMCNGPDKAAHYHVFIFKLKESSHTWQTGWSQNKDTSIITEQQYFLLFLTAHNKYKTTT